ncbi:unnamed protein product [Choristocarpus tenellus]
MTGVVSPNMEETLSRLASIDGLEFNVHINRSSRLAGRLAFLKQPLEKARDLNLQPSILSTLAQIVAESEKRIETIVSRTGRLCRLKKSPLSNVLALCAIIVGARS